jgi:hypothetical protein
VNRATAAFAALALIASLALAPGSGALAGTPGAGAADCAWQRHGKRVVKHVKRDGRLRRVVRVKHWWSCNPVAEPPVIAVPPAPEPSPGPAPAPAPSDPEPPRRVSVKAKEFSFTLSRLFVVAGDVTVELNNQGEDPHNLKLQLEGGEGPELDVGEAGPAKSQVASFELAPGTYRLWCSLPQHEDWGMEVDLEVKEG